MEEKIEVQNKGKENIRDLSIRCPEVMFFLAKLSLLLVLEKICIL